MPDQQQPAAPTPRTTIEAALARIEATSPTLVFRDH